MSEKNRKKSIVRSVLKKAGILVLLITAAVGITGIAQRIREKTAVPKSDLKYVFVHGLSGWGSYDLVDHFFPYWGLSGGSVIHYLRREGYDSYAASVAPTGSAWDRACELYAQLTGTVVDYGEAHSSRCGHERYGRDFSKEPLIQDFEDSKIVLIGHSFGGATVRLFSEILSNGSEEEKEATQEAELSDFFKGGESERIFSIVTLAAPNNGTTAYDLHEDPTFDEASIEIPEKYVKAGNMVSKGTKAKTDERIPEDYAAYDMHIDHAYALNEKISTLKDVYYFAYPCSVVYVNEDGELTPDPDITESMFMSSAIRMSRYTGTTAGGIRIDETWQSNDGLVNEISARTPSGAPGTVYTEGERIETGIWYEMPLTIGDHMYFQGGMTKRVRIRPFYLQMVEMIGGLNEKEE